LVRDKTFGLGKRHYHNGNTPLIEFFLDSLHLSEVLLAGQSGKMTEEDK
jgi:hypothetical protein